ncbi:MAG: hypothetical protein Ct9H90mP3_1540 [Flammeovirgaceae bacterium]|nr:MAG: hypothetical protein Ct9H90mP3_1540 [Flammeovirgaceae bacterium]
MGDTGSFSIGAIIAVLAIIVKKELLIPLLCGIFLIENLSVIIQVLYFKIQRKNMGKGKDFFLWLRYTITIRKKVFMKLKLLLDFGWFPFY